MPWYEYRALQIVNIQLGAFPYYVSYGCKHYYIRVEFRLKKTVDFFRRISMSDPIDICRGRKWHAFCKDKFNRTTACNFAKICHIISYLFMLKRYYTSPLYSSKYKLMIIKCWPAWLKHQIETTANVLFLPLISPKPGKPYFILFIQKLGSPTGQLRWCCISCICNLFLNWCHLWRCNQIITQLILSVIRSYYTVLCATNDKMVPFVDGLMRERRNSIANALELRLSCTIPSICRKRFPFHDSALGLWLNTQATSPLAPFTNMV